MHTYLLSAALRRPQPCFLIPLHRLAFVEVMS